VLPPCAGQCKNRVRRGRTAALMTLTTAPHFPHIRPNICGWVHGVVSTGLAAVFRRRFALISAS
jgi:hypothetical protein